MAGQPEALLVVDMDHEQGGSLHAWLDQQEALVPACPLRRKALHGTQLGSTACDVAAVAGIVSQVSCASCCDHCAITL